MTKVLKACLHVRPGNNSFAHDGTGIHNDRLSAYVSHVQFHPRVCAHGKQTAGASAAELGATLDSHWKTYNHLIPQRALKHLSPVQALKDWRAKKPELFVKRVYNQPGLDTTLMEEPVRGQIALASSDPGYALLRDGTQQDHPLFASTSGCFYSNVG